jgi:hypothetical protein
MPKHFIGNLVKGLFINLPFHHMQFGQLSLVNLFIISNLKFKTKKLIRTHSGKRKCQVFFINELAHLLKAKQQVDDTAMDKLQLTGQNLN